MKDVEGQVQTFLRSRKFFTCPVLHARIRKMECLVRQVRPPTFSKATRKGVVLLYNNPEDHFCRSDLCKVGLKHREP